MEAAQQAEAARLALGEEEVAVVAAVVVEEAPVVVRTPRLAGSGLSLRWIPAVGPGLRQHLQLDPMRRLTDWGLLVRCPVRGISFSVNVL